MKETELASGSPAQYAFMAGVQAAILYGPIETLMMSPTPPTAASSNGFPKRGRRAKSSSTGPTCCMSPSRSRTSAAASAKS